MDEERLGTMFGWCWESVLGEVPKVLSMSFSSEGVWEGGRGWRGREGREGEGGRGWRGREGREGEGGRGRREGKEGMRQGEGEGGRKGEGREGAVHNHCLLAAVVR